MAAGILYSGSKCMHDAVLASRRRWTAPPTVFPAAFDVPHARERARMCATSILRPHSTLPSRAGAVGGDRRPRTHARHKRCADVLLIRSPHACVCVIDMILDHASDARACVVDMMVDCASAALDCASAEHACMGAEHKHSVNIACILMLSTHTCVYASAVLSRRRRWTAPRSLFGHARRGKQTLYITISLHIIILIYCIIFIFCISH